jgi:flagellar basal-body rod modification protein FlgD
VTLSIYDVAGRVVRTLEAGSRGAGLHEVRWDGRSEDGRVVAAGTYFAALEAGGEVVTAKLNVLK